MENLIQKSKINLGVVTSNPLVKTGFSDNAKALLGYLYKTNKYNIFLLSQSSHQDDPALSKMPWKTTAAIQPSKINHDLFARDAGYQRSVAYGNLVIKDFILDNKIEVLILQEDPWAFNLDDYCKSEWYKHLRPNIVLNTTADSLPILPHIKEWCSYCDNIWFWTSFAEKALKQEDLEKYKNIRTVPGTTNIDAFKPLSWIEKRELRNQFGIKDDEKVIFYLGRNQLRKLYFSHLEALSKFKKQHPENKVKLLFHCSWQEGWGLARFIEEFKLDNVDVFTSYFCSQCAYWDVRNYYGDNIECPSCKNKNSFQTAGITSNISDGDLNKIYNLADGACSVFTSGGLEYFNVCSLLAGLPLACVPYSAGEDFTCHDFVTTINGQYTRECGTNFKKFVPDINSIVKFYKKICDLDARKKQEITLAGRKWASEYFSIERIGKIFEEFIDSRQKIEWDYVIHPAELKNPSANIVNIEDGGAWVKSLYKEILKMTVEDSDSGLLHWIESLKNGMKRSEVENYFRQVGISENQKLGNQQQVNLSDIFNSQKKKILVVCKESLGDNYLISSLLPDLRARFPKEEYFIYYSTSPQYFDVFAGNENVDSLIPWNEQFENELAMTGTGAHKGFVDHLIVPPILTQRILGYLSKPPPSFSLTKENLSTGIGFNYEIVGLETK